MLLRCVWKGVSASHTHTPGVCRSAVIQPAAEQTTPWFWKTPSPQNQARGEMHLSNPNRPLPVHPSPGALDSLSRVDVKKGHWMTARLPHMCIESLQVKVMWGSNLCKALSLSHSVPPSFPPHSLSLPLPSRSMGLQIKHNHRLKLTHI